MPRKKQSKPASEAPSEEEKKTSGHRKSQPRSMWSGSISFGLVNIPVKMYSAVKAKDVHFHMLHQTDKSRVEQHIFCMVENKEISRDDVVKGYEIGKGQYVVVNKEELDSLAPKASRMIELIHFVDLAEIDPVYYDHAYYLVPEKQSAKAYQLLLQALSHSKKVGIGKFVMRNKEYIAAIRPVENVICMETMFFADEVVSFQDLPWETSAFKVQERELETAKQLIDSLAGHFEPEALHDDYREAVMSLIEKKAQGQEIVTQPVSEEAPTEVVDLMSALEASLAEARKKKKKAA